MRPPARRRRRSCARWGRSAETSCRRRAAGTGGWASTAGSTAASAASRRTARTASTRSSATSNAHPRIRPTSPPRSVALGATLRTTQRELAVADLYRLPTAENRDVTTLAPDELILELDVPRAGSVDLSEGDGPEEVGVPDRRRRRCPIFRRGSNCAGRGGSDPVDARLHCRSRRRHTSSRAPPTRSRSPAPSSAARLQR